MLPSVATNANRQNDEIREAIFLLERKQPPCENWVFGVGDCGHCESCRVSKCVEDLESLLTKRSLDALPRSKNVDIKITIETWNDNWRFEIEDKSDFEIVKTGERETFTACAADCLAFVAENAAQPSVQADGAYCYGKW